MYLNGKGMFIWNIANCEKGDPVVISNLAAQAGLSHVLIKIADGIGYYNVDKKKGIDYISPLVQELRAHKIQTWGWHYVYGFSPTGEADRAIELVQRYGLDGYVIDAELEFKKPGRDKAARQFMDRLRPGLPGVPIALSSYRFPSYHANFPWKPFLERVDFVMPQVYWLMAHNPADQLQRCLKEFQNLTPVRPVFPTGAAFKQGNWSPSLQDMQSFMDASRNYNLGGVNYWEWSNCRRHLKDVWDVIANYYWPAPTNEVDIIQQYVTALNGKEPSKLAVLYNTQAVHVTKERTIQGISPIREWYSRLFTDILPQAEFKIGNLSGKGVFRNLSWTAVSPKGKVFDGNDTIALANDQIAFHYSSFSITN